MCVYVLKYVCIYYDHTVLVYMCVVYRVNVYIRMLVLVHFREWK